MMLREIIRSAKRQLEDSSIKPLAIEFQSTMNEFLALSEHARLANPEYDEALNEMLDAICENFNLKRQMIHVKVSNYTANVWGNVYWHFLHLSSILITYLLSNHKIENMLNLPLLVYNIDCILPCPVCAHHYASIKTTNAVQATIKEISFGNAMSGLQAFHNLVTENVDKTLEYANRPKRPLFTIVDFAKAYKCIELPPNNLLKSITYIRNKVDWQSDDHRILATFYALTARMSYISSSEFLKRNVYSSNASESTIDNVVRTIRNGILMNIDPELMSVESNVQIYNDVLREMYSEYPDYVRNLIQELPDNDDDDDDGDDDTKNNNINNTNNNTVTVTTGKGIVVGSGSESRKSKLLKLLDLLRK